MRPQLAAHGLTNTVASVQADQRGFTAKVSDFGLSRMFQASKACPQGAQAQAEGEGAGTVTHMAPESLAGEPATLHGDVYAFGIMSEPPHLHSPLDPRLRALSASRQELPRQPCSAVSRLGQVQGLSRDRVATPARHSSFGPGCVVAALPHLQHALHRDSDPPA